MDLDEPILRPLPNHGTFIGFQTHNPVGSQPLQRLNHRGSAHAEPRSDLGAFQFRATGQFAANDCEQNLLVDAIDARLIKFFSSAKIDCLYGILTGNRGSDAAGIFFH
ncbi:MAG TPA: hypothetical protein VHZ24_16420 [Pirellulales bacterium]|nr:hypothetical protein [Pirellulales bacterium]